jgi:hypothetical protein
VRVSDNILEGHVAGVEVGERALFVDHFHGCARHCEGECGFASASITDDDDSLVILGQSLCQLEAVREILEALRYTFDDINFRHDLYL